MSPAHVLEPTYRVLKHGLMQGNWRPGERLEALRLADEYGVSMTPVRDCLNRLVGERLVDMQPGEGYRVPRITEKILRDMLDLNMALLDFALLNPASGRRIANTGQTVADYAVRLAALFSLISEGSANSAVTDMVQSLGDRMHAIRRWEPQVFPDCFRELDELEASLEGDGSDLSGRLRTFHERRLNTIAELVQLAQS